MTTIIGQILTSTEVDAHGEQRDKGFLDDLATRLPSRFPLNQHHDMAKPTVGFIENFRVEADGDGWALKGDVTFDGPAPTEGGFSFSTTEMIHRASEPRFMTYVPYPFYRDDWLIQEIATANPDSNVGKWIKKGVSVPEAALIISTLGLLIAPAWKRTYDDHVHPRVADLAASVRDALQRKGAKKVRVEYLQPVHLEAYTGPVELYFVPSEHAADALVYGFALKEAIGEGMETVEIDWAGTGKEIKRIIYLFDPDTCRYRPSQIIYADGSTRTP